MTNIYKRGYIEMKLTTYGMYSRYIKRMPQFGISVPFYAGYPIKVRNAEKDILVDKNGNETPLCLSTH